MKPIVIPSSHEAIDVDEHENGAKDLVMNPTIQQGEVLYEFQDDIILKDPVVPHGLDNMRRGKDHEVACGQQRC